MCHRSINYVAEMMETKFGIPWIKVNFIGAEATAKSLRKIAAYFDDPELTDRVEEVIAREMPAVEPVREEVKARCEGKTAMLFVGGSRAHHYQELFREIGMETIAAGYEFAHRDDYEGRQVLPGLKVDADSRNIEELHVEPDPERFRPRLRRRGHRAAGQGRHSRFKRLRGHDAGDGERRPGHRRHQPVRNRAAHRNLQAGHLLRRHQGKVRHPEERRAHEAAPQLRLQRTLCRLQGRHQLLPGDRPDGQQQGLEVS